MSALTRLCFPIVFIVGLAVAVLLAFAVFSTTGSAQQDDAAGKQTDTAAKEATDTGGKEVTTERHKWKNYHWAREVNPFTVKLGDNVSQADLNNPVTNWDSYLATASSDWSLSSVLDAPVVAGGTTDDPKTCDYTLGRVEVCNAAYGPTGWLGLAQIWITRGSHITQGRALMNDTYYALDEYNTAAERAHVMCQEIGHMFGLGHTSEDGTSQQTCMDYSTDSMNSQHPNAHDYEQLETIYSNLDKFTTIIQRPPAAARGNYDTPDKWGQLQYISADRKHAVFERQFRDGTSLVTFVEVVEPEKILEDQEDQPQQKQQDQRQQKKNKQGQQKKQDQ